MHQNNMNEFANNTSKAGIMYGTMIINYAIAQCSRPCNEFKKQTGRSWLDVTSKSRGEGGKGLVLSRVLVLGLDEVQSPLRSVAVVQEKLPEEAISKDPQNHVVNMIPRGVTVSLQKLHAGLGTLCLLYLFRSGSAIVWLNPEVRQTVESIASRRAPGPLGASTRGGTSSQWPLPVPWSLLRWFL